MQSPAPGKGDALAPIQAGDRLVREQLCGRGPGDPECEALTAETANGIPRLYKQEHEQRD